MSVVAVVLKGYPRLSETFIAQEIRALEKRGLNVRIISLRLPTDGAIHPVHREIVAPVQYLPEYLYRQPLRVLRAWWAVRRWPTYHHTRRIWWRDLLRDLTPNRVRRFGQAMVLAHELTDDVDQLYAHFLHTPASVARYAAILRNLPWSVSAHAKDIWTIPDWEKSEKLNDCRWAVTCTQTNADHLMGLAPDPSRVSLVYHGLDLSRFGVADLSPSHRDGRDPKNPVQILAVGRAVEKKGFDALLAALALLPESLNWRLVHIGGGPLKKRLIRDAVARGIDERIKWVGAQPQETVIDYYREADMFVLPCRITNSGDRDGLPNVLMEAQSQGLPCISTSVSAVPELIEDGVNGLLVPPDDPPALAAAAARLIADPPLRARMGEAGRKRVQDQFSLEACIGPLAQKFGVAGEAQGVCESLSTPH